MKKFFTLIFLAAASVSVSAQKTNPDYDSVLVKKLGADERGMKMYVLVLLKSGPNKGQDSTTLARLSASHFANINRMAAEKKLLVAGPLDKNKQAYRGIFIIDVTSIAEAEKLVIRDLAVKEGLLEAEYYNWYGSAALPEYIPFDQKIRKTLP